MVLINQLKPIINQEMQTNAKRCQETQQMPRNAKKSWNVHGILKLQGFKGNCTCQLDGKRKLHHKLHMSAALYFPNN